MKRAPAPEWFDPVAFRGKTAGVLGLGLSGLHCANLLAERGFKVFASESKSREAAADSLGRLAQGVRHESGGHTERLLEADFIVKSPGLKPGLPILERIRKAGLPVFSEVEVALAFSPTGDLWAVTGTNGKTTTTALLGAILSRAGRTVHVAGNIGLPLSQAVRSARPGDAIVAELSSYQLEDSRFIRPRIASILNITPDHLDHHADFKAYVEAKSRIFKFQHAEDSCIFNQDDRAVRDLAKGCPSRPYFFGRGPTSQARIGQEGIELREGSRVQRLAPPSLLGAHNLENAAAAALMAAAGGVAASAIQTAFKTFKGVEHRLEPVGTVDGVQVVNDSKATNVDSTRVALEAFAPGGKRLLLILGGLDKGSPYTPLAPLVKATARAVLTIGQAAPLIERDLAGAAPIHPCGTLSKAVAKAFKLAEPGDVLLLSPACASFDQFKNFEDRGRAFKELIRERRGAKTR